MPQPHSSENENEYNTADAKNEAAVPAHQPFNLQLDTGNEYLRFRQKWWQLWLPKDPPAPAPASLEDAKMTPLATTSILSEFTYTWITDIMVIFFRYFTYSPKLMMDPSREAGRLSEKLEAAWARRVAAAADWNDRLEKGEIDPSFLTRLSFVFRAILASRGMKERTYAERRAALEKHWREVNGGRKLVLRHWGYIASSWVLSYSSLSSRLLRNEPQHEQLANPPPVLVVVSVQFFWRSMATGVLARAALIASIYERGVSLTGKARVELTNATLVNHISSDVSRIDACAHYFLGPSALAGFALFVIIIPIQERIMSSQHRNRLHSMVWTDQRVKVLLEVLITLGIPPYPRKAHTRIESSNPKPTGRHNGALEFNRREMSYRPGLATRAQPISLQHQSAEKIVVLKLTEPCIDCHQALDISTIDSDLDQDIHYYLRTSCLSYTPSDTEEVVSGDEPPQKGTTLTAWSNTSGRANLSVGLARALREGFRQNRPVLEGHTISPTAPLLLIVHRCAYHHFYDRDSRPDAGPMAIKTKEYTATCTIVRVQFLKPKHPTSMPASKQNPYGLIQSLQRICPSRSTGIFGLELQRGSRATDLRAGRCLSSALSPVDRVGEAKGSAYELHRKQTWWQLAVASRRFDRACAGTAPNMFKLHYNTCQVDNNSSSEQIDNPVVHQLFAALHLAKSPSYDSEAKESGSPGDQYPEYCVVDMERTYQALL
ncbi:hypothetical protein BU15DRAFT_62991 [Melanogaster broomeanus]|nr:hypothetical protein BU15DRAFT_62991 [Melanogaster broomeanus]